MRFKFSPEILKFYFITDEASPFSVSDQITAAIEGGATIVQYRNKSGDIRKKHREALEVAEICRKNCIPFIINDDVILAKAVGADGVHTGQDDVHPSVVREIMGDDAILGISVSTPDEFARTDIKFCDYLGTGPVFATGTKTDANPVIGCSGLSEICRISPLPVVAIGGITADKAKQCIESGACGVCMISAISRAKNPLEAALEFGAVLGTVKKNIEYYSDETALLKDVLETASGHEDFRKMIKIKPGDDACLLETIQRPVISTDCQIEDVHFRLLWQSPYETGRKAVSVCLSDLAASYAKPVAVFLNLGIPDGFTKEMTRELYRGIQASLEKYRCGLGGGNIAKSRVLSLDLFAIGEGSEIFPLRSNAKPGYCICSTGLTGLARCGLLMNMKPKTQLTQVTEQAEVNELTVPNRLTQPDMHRCKQPESIKNHEKSDICGFSGRVMDAAFRNPCARFDAAEILERHGVDCVMDISDGIVADAFRMAEVSGATIRLIPENFPIHDEMKKFCGMNGLDPLREAIQGGEDYELLFACEESVFHEIKKEIPEAFIAGTCLTFSGKRLANLPSGVDGFDHLSKTDR